MDTPKDMKPVLAKIEHQNSLGLSSWFEVVYFDEEYTESWKSYSDSTTFKDGERVVAWEYVENIKLTDVSNA